MTNSRSTEQEGIQLSDKAILHALSNCENEFRAGEREALFRALVICGRHQAVFPEWVANAILDGDVALKSGQITDFNELFGSPFASKRSRQREARIIAHTDEVLSMLAVYRCDGGSLNVEQAFGEISENTGISRRDVEEIYRRYGAWIKGIPQGNPSGEGHGFSICEIPVARRRGRPIL